MNNSIPETLRKKKKCTFDFEGEKDEKRRKEKRENCVLSKLLSEYYNKYNS